jgi:hypothetical protein
MTDERQATHRGRGFKETVAKKALAPIVASAAAAATAYLMQKSAEVWHVTLQPKIEEKGGGKAVASEALEGIRERLPDSVSEKLDGLASMVSAHEQFGGEDATASNRDRADERRRREQRRRQRRHALEQTSAGDG